MRKWADYCISAVRYSDAPRHIIRAKVHEDKGDTIGEAEEWTRLEIVKKIENGRTFVTIFKTENGKWRKGEDVHVIEIRGKKYIRTDKNEIEEDNLGSLPEF